MSSVFGNKIGRYILLEKLGEGGMAIVYNAYDTRLDMNVALKIVLPAQRHKESFVQRFLTEGKSLAQLSHPNIVKVIDYGEWDGLPYLVMDYITGGTLKDQMNSEMTWEEAAASLAPIARALDYVHQQKIIHRDVKPSNILIDSSGTPKLSDFGIVKVVEEEETQEMTAVGVGVGTPDYMSPEQGLGREVDSRADIYALGVIFYELVTGRKLFTAETPMGVIIKHATEPVIKPSKINPEIPPEINEVILKSLAKDPDKRYSSMEVFAKILEVLSAGGEQALKRVANILHPKPKRTWLWAGLGTSVILTAAIFYIWFIGFLNLSGVTSLIYGSPTPTVRATTNSQIIIPKAVTPTIAVVANATEQPVIIPADKTVEATPIPKVNTPSYYPVLIDTPVPAISSSLVAGVEIARLGIGKAEVITWSPDSKTLALGTSAGIYLFDSTSYHQTGFINSDGWMRSLIFSPDSAHLISGTIEGNSSLWRLNGNKLSDLTTSGPNPVSSVAYAPSGKYYALGLTTGMIYVYDANTGKRLITLEQHGEVNGLSFSSDTRFLSSGSTDGEIYIWDLASGKSHTSYSEIGVVSDVMYSNDGRWLVEGGLDSRVRVFDAATNTLYHTYQTQRAPVVSLAITNDGEIIAAGLKNGDIFLWRTSDRSKIMDFKAHPDAVRGLSFSPDGKHLASASWEESLNIWNVADGTQIYTYENHIDDVQRLIFSPNSKYVASSSVDETVRFWDVQTSSAKFIFPGHLARGSSFSPDGRYLVVVSEAEPNWSTNGKLTLWDTQTGEQALQLTGYTRGWDVSFSPDGTLLASGSIQQILVWDTATWQLLKTTGGYISGCGIYYTADHRNLAAILDAGITFEWSEKIHRLCTVKESANGTSEMLAPDSTWALLRSPENRLQIWNMITELDPEFVRSGVVVGRATSISADSSMFMVSGSNNISLVSVNTRKTIWDRPRNDLYEYQGVISPDGKLVALGSSDGTLRIFKIK